MTQLQVQVLVILSPEGELQVEQSTHGHRRVIPLTQASAGRQLFRLLSEQKKRLDGERAERVARKFAQPDFYVIAKHHQVEIRQMLPGAGVGTSTARVTPEDLGL